ncbi:MAG: exopolyphosphatase [Formivibrio sp.]|nr:exopolyphosphatase [Formivibrio sp.]
MPDTPKYRLVTRSDFDGLVCAILLRELHMIDDILFVHPKDMQDGRIAITHRDITTNLPYVAEARMVFDHHYSETLRNEGERVNHIINPNAPSASRLVYEYYGGKEAFPAVSEELLEAVDRADSGAYTIHEILEPQGWVLLNYMIDARTGLGRFKTFRISNCQLMMDLIGYCRNHSIEEILALPDVQERVTVYQEHAPLAREQILRYSKVYDNLVVLDLRHEETIYATNRFLIYALFPDCTISIHVLRGKNQLNTVFAVGKSIINRRSRTNIGELMLHYQGGGHENAGTCQIANEDAEKVLCELILKITEDG